jgi:predicted P-type ATPase
MKRDDEEITISGHKSSPTKTVLFWIAVILTGGLYFILSTLHQRLKAVSTKNPCSLSEADIVLIQDTDGEYSLEKVHDDKGIRHFVYKKIKYVFCTNTGTFEQIKGLDLTSETGQYFLRKSNDGLSNEEASTGLLYYGINSISIEIKSIHRIILDEISSPFYMYQLFIIVIWMLQFYYQFAMCIFLFSCGSVTLHVIESRKQSLLLREKIHSESSVLVMRNKGVVLEMSSKHLVPGDTLILPLGGRGITLECDAVLLNGRCTVDESMLTGESVPVSKNPIDPLSLHTKSSNDKKIRITSELKKSTLYCGTKILSSHLNAEKKKTTGDLPSEMHLKALVISTGYSTSKGELVRTILFPKNVNMKLMKDYVKCMLLFFGLGIPCMAYTFFVFHGLNAAMMDTLLTVVDVATFLCPPLLPAVMTAINSQAQRRLRRKKIFCLNPSFINFSGGLDVIVFDKTGTLTEDTLDFEGILPVLFSSDDDDGEKDSTATFTSQKVVKSEEANFPPEIIRVIGCCHSLVQIEGKTEGESLELQMFKSIDWEFKTCDKGNHPEGTLFTTGPVVDREEQIFHVIRVFPFESYLQRMLVVIYDAAEKKFSVLLKGAPEVIVELCDRRTVPSNFENHFQKLTQKGYRVLAAAVKELDAGENPQHLTREGLEENLTFSGLLVFQNKLKPETAATMIDLKHKANIRTIMATGDNIQTAAYVAKQCDLVGYQENLMHVKASLGESGRLILDTELIPGRKIDNELKINLLDKSNFVFMIEGSSYETIRDYDLTLFERIVNKGSIFARMTPDQKLSLVTELQRQGHIVGMCGDGANDCGALRAANTGISLSTMESSVASSFTYTEKNIECFPKLILEGKATLFASFASFKYQTVYCFCLLSAVMILMIDGQKPSDFGYVFVDIILNILPPLVFGSVKPSTVLTADRPQRSLFAFTPLFQIFSFTAIQASFYLFGRALVISQPFYEDFHFNATRIHEPEPSHMQVAILSLNTMTYIIAGIIFSTGSPFRQGILSSSKC